MYLMGQQQLTAMRCHESHNVPDRVALPCFCPKSAGCSCEKCFHMLVRKKEAQLKSNCDISTDSEAQNNQEIQLAPDRTATRLPVPHCHSTSGPH